jgi:PilZ domain
MSSAAEKRKNLRRTITYPAFIDLGDGSPAIECTLCDASQEGALLAVANPESVPNEFILALSSDGAARRRCRVAWRTKDQVGVEFLKEIKKTPQPLRRPVMPSSALQPAAASTPAELAVRVDIDTLATN